MPEDQNKPERPGYGDDRRAWHPGFVEYMYEIVEHPAYSGMPAAMDDEGNAYPAARTIGARTAIYPRTALSPNPISRDRSEPSDKVRRDADREDSRDRGGAPLLRGLRRVCPCGVVDHQLRGRQQFGRHRFRRARAPGERRFRELHRRQPLFASPYGEEVLVWRRTGTYEGFLGSQNGWTLEKDGSKCSRRARVSPPSWPSIFPLLRESTGSWCIWTTRATHQTST